MSAACGLCDDTGSLSKSLYGALDCAACPVAGERVQLAEFITTQRDEPHVLAWRVHVRAAKLALGDESARGTVRKEVADFTAAPEPTLLRKKFFDLPLGTRFRYIGGKSDWIVLERHGYGKVAGYQPHDGWVAGQSICSFADSEEECRALEVDVVIAPTSTTPAQQANVLPTTLSTNIQNSANSAALTEPHETCGACGGTGYYAFGSTDECEDCKGEGKVHVTMREWK